ncbi:TniB family NTP-binding protein [Duganella sp. FT3S]|uniref:TniB family NTP-binding protein n=1 Tax=Rugamonas fusca TaxID=2758568 RepID=A0A7W2EK29_9BURK|nr:TniB family NTP-binding protein [Rugamonas fusca]MBA5607380.1 TniB family NTP-binding protein [Rugamonas fusca]
MPNDSTSPRTARPDHIADKGKYISFSIRHQVIEFNAFREGWRKISHVHNRGIHAQIAGGLLLVGQSGAGKTTLIEHYRDSFPVTEHPEQTMVPILVVQTPAMPTVKNLAEAILHALGDPDVNKGSTEEKTRRIFKLLVACHVELLIIDEFQHFCDSRRRSVANQVADWLKGVLNVARIPVVVVGLPRAEEVIRMNEQLARRFSSVFFLRPFNFHTDEAQDEFRGLLKTVHKFVPVSCIAFHEANLALRFFIATNGLIDYIAKIIDEAVQIAGRMKNPSIDWDILFQAFGESVWRNAPEELNPFNPDAELRPLNKLGEPFERRDKLLLPGATSEDAD